jgi:hypothetical protein
MLAALAGAVYATVDHEAAAATLAGVFIFEYFEYESYPWREPCPGLPPP